jgi:hypothetical protein
MLTGEYALRGMYIVKHTGYESLTYNAMSIDRVVSPVLFDLGKDSPFAIRTCSEFLNAILWTA